MGRQKGEAAGVNEVTEEMIMMRGLRKEKYVPKDWGR